jgi:N-acetyl-gamma-glutamylphosphate reductase
MPAEETLHIPQTHIVGLEKAHATWYAYSKHRHAREVSKAARVFHSEDNNTGISQHATQINVGYFGRDVWK